MRGTGLRIAAAFAATTLAMTCLAGPALATYPGRNGRITFTRFTPGAADDALYTANPNGSDVEQVFQGPTYCPEWSPDGTRLAFTIATQGIGLIATIDPDGGNLQVLGPGECASWSPDQSRLVFDYTADDPNDPAFRTALWVMNSDGSNRHPLLTAARSGFDVEPRWSPNSLLITFVRIHKFVQGVQQEAVFTVNANGTDPRQLTSNGLAPEHPTWSPNGQWIVFNDASFKPGAHETIWTMRANGARRHVIYQGTGNTGGVKPHFSPDGTHIVFACITYGSAFGAGHTEDICTMRADGSHVVDVTNTDQAFENNPAWQPAK